MPSLKNFDTAFRPYNTTFGPIAKVTPDEEDGPIIYNIAFPGTSNTYYFLGTVTGTGANQITAIGGTAALLHNMADYPRNLLFQFPGTQTGGSITVFGKDQFGYKISETIGQATGTGGGLGAAGTKIFASVGSATVNASGTGLGTYKLGYAVGTAAGSVALFGLPTKIAGTADVVNVAYYDGTSVMSAYNTPWSAVAGAPNHTFAGTHIVVGNETYVLTLNARWDNTSQPTFLYNANTAGSSFG